MSIPASRIPFPLKGLNLTVGYRDQPVGTSNDVLNVRPFDSIEGRMRGGRRPGLSKWLDEPVLVDQPIQLMLPVTKAIPYEESVTSYEAEYVMVGYLDGSSHRLRIYDYNDGGLEDTYEFFGTAGYFVCDTVSDAAGDVYVAATERTTDWPGASGVQANVWKVQPEDGTVLWSHDFIGGSDTRIYRIAYDPVYDRVVVGGFDADYATTGTVVRVLDATDGTVLWTYELPDSTDSGRVAVAVDPLGNVFFSRQPSVSNPGYIHKLSPTGLLLGRYRFVASSGLGGYEPSDIAISAGGRVAAISGRSSDSWDGGAVARNLYILDNDLSLQETYEVASSGAGSCPSVVWADDGELVVYHGVDATPSNHDVRKFDVDTGTVSWRFYTGDGSPPTRASNLEKGVDGNIIVCVDTENTAWDGAGGNTASMWRLDVTDGSVDWYAGDDTIRGLSSVHIEGESTTITTAQPRETALLVVVAGSIFTVQNGELATPINGIGALSGERLRVEATAAYNKAFLVDGENSKVYDFATDTVSTWVASAGTLPSAARLITRYRGRIVLSGVSTDAHNWFMSKQGDPDDWDYAPATPTSQDAVAGNNSPAGLVGDVITALMPFNDDLMWFGCNSSIWQMTGDPLHGGAIDLVSDQTGMTFGDSWAKDPGSTVYFHGIDGIYRIQPGTLPVSITAGRLDEVFRSVDRSNNRVILSWNYLEKQLWVLISPFDGTTAAGVYVYDTRTDSWWKDSYPATMGPDVLLSYDAEVGSDEAFLFGCRDGYIRKQDRTATGDDGTAITSRVRFEPVLSDDPEKMVRLTGMSFGLVEGSGAVDVRVFAAQTPEQLADATAARFRRTLVAGHNGPALPRLEAGAIGLELYAEGLAAPWALEDMGIRTTTGGRLRRHRR